MGVGSQSISGNALKISLITASIVLLTILPVLAHAESIFSQIIEIPPTSIFNNLPSPYINFTYWYNNMSGGLIYLQPYNYYFDVFNASYGEYVFYSVWSTSPVALYIYIPTEQQYELLATGTNITGQYYVNEPGTYYIKILNNGTEPALIIYVRTLTNSPSFGQWAFPIGIADYGIALINDSIFAYSYVSNEFVGKVAINNAITNEPNTCPSGSVEPGRHWFSVQLNTVMVVNTTNGQTQYYWLQNVIQFNSLNNTFRILDNVWNSSSIYSILSNSSISGNGVVGVVYALGNNYYYWYATEYMYASLPFTTYLVIKTGLTSSGYPWVAFGYSYDGKSITWFDNVTIKVKASSAYMEVSPTLTGYGVPDDAELVIAGPWNRECTFAKSLNISLALYFAWPYPSDEYLSPVPSMWSFGSDTAEAIYNAYSIPIDYGVVNVLSGFEELSPLNTYYFIYTINPTIFTPLTITNSLNGTTAAYVYTKGSIITLNEPEVITIVPGESRYFFAGYVINNTYTASTNVLSLRINGPTSIYINYTLQYRLMINDPSGLLSGLSGWYNEDDVVRLTEPLIHNLNNGTRLVFNAYYIYPTGTVIASNTTTITMNNPYTITVNWTRQYQVNVNNPIPVIVSIPGAPAYNTTSLSTWVNDGAVVSILIPKYYVFSNGTRLVFMGSNESMVVNSPLSISIPLSEFTRQYLVTVSSLVPVLVSIQGMPPYNTTSLSMWVNSSLTMSILAPKYYMFSNGTRLMYTGSNRTFTINKPLSVSIPLSSFMRQYLIIVSSPVPVTFTVLGIPIASGLTVSDWVNSSLMINILVPKYYVFNNNTRLAFMGSNESLTVNSPLNISIPMSEFIHQYTVTVNSPIPVTLLYSGLMINGSLINTWINNGSAISILIPRYYTFNNDTRLMYMDNNESTVINSPLSISIPPSGFLRQYLITVNSNYPVSINGTRIVSLSDWFNEGEVLTVAPETIFINGVFMSEPGYMIIVNKPQNITIPWSINYALTLGMYLIIIAVVAAIIITAHAHGKRQ